MNAATFFKSSVQAELAIAAADGSTHELDSLAARGAQINEPGVDGMTLIYWAMRHESKKGVAWLLEHGANPNLTFAQDGRSAVSLAAMEPDPWFLKEMLAHGGDPNYRNPLSQHTPIMDAILPLNADNAQTLIAAGADLNTFDVQGYSVLFNACANQRYEMVYDMLLAGADPTIKMGARGSTILGVLRRSRVTPGIPGYEWLSKVREFLRQKGLDVDNGH